MSRARADLLLLLAAFIWGTTFVAQQFGTLHVGPFAYTGARFLLGACVVLPFALRECRQLNLRGIRFDRRDMGATAALGVLLFLGAALQQIGIMRTTVTNAAFLTAVYVPLVPLLGYAVFRHLPHWSVWPASLGCLAGTWLLSGAQAVTLGSGDWWVIASAVFWSFHLLFVGPVAARKGAPLTVAALQCLICAALAWTWAAVSEPIPLAGLVQAGWSIAYAGLLSVGLGFTWQVVAQRHTRAADAAIILSSETVFAAAAGALVLGERLSTQQLTGCGLILAGIVAVQLLPLWVGGRRAARSV